MREPLLAIENLSVSFRTGQGPFQAVSGVDLEIFPGEVVALVGESGSGKSVTALSIARLVADGAIHSMAGRILFRGADLLSMAEADLLKMRGSKIAYVFQEPATALNPVFTVAYQIEESIRLHRGSSTTRHSVSDLLQAVGIRDPQRVADSYPHQLSGGQQQRVMLAIALACDPELLIADEPTTALDVTVQAQILDLLKSLQRSRGLSLLLITHNLAIAARMADRICVMYAGQQVEIGPAEQVVASPAHPYTRALLDAVPRLRSLSGDLRGIPGQLPSGHHWPSACRFHERCSIAKPLCAGQMPPMERIDSDRACRCHFWREMMSP